jgi:precorrin-2 dehydrogenase/sirohydrochlorin ferrochelatase
MGTGSGAGDDRTYYAAALSLKDRRCVVIGGGAVAERKLDGLLEGGANDVLLVSPVLSEGIRLLEAANRIIVRRRGYLEEDLAGAWMAFACTDDGALNAAIAGDAERNRVWCQVADNASWGSLVSPSVVRRGGLLLAVTASGASPSLSMAIKRELELQYGPRYERDVERLRELRIYALKAQIDDKRRRAVLRLAAEEVLQGDGPDPVGGAGELAIQAWYHRLLETTKGRQT